MIVCGTAGRIFTNYSIPFCNKSDVTAQLTVGINRENLPMKPVDWCSRPPAVCSGANWSPRSGSPIACCLPPADYVHALYLWCKRRCCHTLCWHWCFTEIRKLESVNNLNFNDATSKWLALAFYWTAYQYRAQRSSLQHRGRHPHRQEKLPVNWWRRKTFDSDRKFA